MNLSRSLITITLAQSYIAAHIFVFADESIGRKMLKN